MKIEYNSPILVIGAGSVGERHIKNLWSLGYRNILVYRQRNIPLRTISEIGIKVFNEWNKIVEEKPVFAIICTPTSQHICQAIECAKNGIHILVEKPLSNTIENLQVLKELIENNNIAMRIGYMLHFHPCLKKIKDFVDNKTYGELLYFNTYWGEYLPDWHPWEDYRQSYAARRDMGGGAALTLSHDLDIALWLAGSELVDYKTVYNCKATLEVDVESSADFLLKFCNGVTGHVHLNFFQKSPHREYMCVFDNATVTFNYYTSRIIIKSDNQEQIYEEPFFDRNNLFIDELKSFISVVNTEENYIVRSCIELEKSQLIIEMATKDGMSDKHKR